MLEYHEKMILAVRIEQEAMQTTRGELSAVEVENDGFITREMYRKLELLRWVWQAAKGELS